MIGIPFTDLHEIDKELETSEQTVDWTVPNTNMLQELQSRHQQDNDNNDDEEEEPEKEPTSAGVATKALSTLKDFFCENGLINELTSLNKMNDTLLKMIPEKGKQKNHQRLLLLN